MRAGRPSPSLPASRRRKCMFDASRQIGPRRERHPEEETAHSRRRPAVIPAYEDRTESSPFIPDATKPDIIVSFLRLVVVAVRHAQVPRIVVPRASPDHFRSRSHSAA